MYAPRICCSAEEPRGGCRESPYLAIGSRFVRPGRSLISSHTPFRMSLCVDRTCTDAANSGAYSQAPRTLSVHLRTPREPSSGVGEKDRRLHCSRACDFKRIFATCLLSSHRCPIAGASGGAVGMGELAFLVARVRPSRVERRHTFAFVPRCGRTTILFAARRSAFNVRLSTPSHRDRQRLAANW